MREIDKLLHEIPLDELMGEADAEIMSKPIIYEQGGKELGAARVKTHKAGAVAAVAAALALVIGGAVYLGLNPSKLTPYSYNSKNGVSSPIENQNRSLIEQEIEKSGGDPKIWGNRLVAFDKNNIPENYLNTGMDVDFQVLGYTYSGKYAQVFFGFENHKAEFAVDNETYYTNEYENYEAEIKKATEEGDYQKAKKLIENKPNSLTENESYIKVDYDITSIALKNSSGELVGGTNSGYERGISGQQLGDYFVWYENIDMTNVPDNTLTLTCDFANKNCKPVTFTLDKYTNDGYEMIDCDAPTVIAYQSSTGEILDGRVKKISYSTGNAIVEIETDKKLADNEKVIRWGGSLVRLEDGTTFAGDMVVPVYNDKSSPFSHSVLASYYDDGKLYLTLNYAAVPMDISRIDSFIIGTAKISANGNSGSSYGVVDDVDYTNTESAVEENTHSYTGQYERQTLENGSQKSLFTKGLDKVNAFLDGMASYEEIDPSGYDAVIVQGKMITVYDENGNIKYIADPVAMLDDYNEATGEYKTSIKAIRINGKCVKVTDKQYAEFGRLTEALKKDEL